MNNTIRRNRSALAVAECLEKTFCQRVFDTPAEAANYTTSIYTYVRYNQIKNVKISKQGNTVTLTKEEVMTEIDTEKAISLLDKLKTMAMKMAPVPVEHIEARTDEVENGPHEQAVCFYMTDGSYISVAVGKL